jgi:hypothetical protein
MGLEAIFDSWGKEDFRKNLCACLGENTLVFPDWHAQRPNLTVGDIAFDLYDSSGYGSFERHWRFDRGASCGGGRFGGCQLCEQQDRRRCGD